jgi:hypothetical protein
MSREMPFQPSNAKRRVRWHRASWWLQCLLLITAWNGPVLYCHSHGTLANTSSHLTGWLGKHLQTYHPEVSLFANQLFQWHVHVELPSQPGRAPEDDSQRLPQATPLIVAGETGVMFAGRITEPVPAWMLVEIELPRGASIAGRSSFAQIDHFFGAFAPTLAVPLRFCVIRC